MNFYKDISSKLNIDSLIFEKKFYSKKNQVYLVKNADLEKQDEKFVIKIYKNAQDLTKELNILRALKENEVRVPKVLLAGEDYILLENIPGQTMTDYLEQIEKDGLPPDNAYWAADDLCEWLLGFYKAVQNITDEKVIMKDVNLRNFIVAKDGIYGIDFEEVSAGYPEEDIGKICAFLLTYRPEFTPWKINVAKYIRDRAIEKLKINPNLVMNELNRELSAIKKRRKSTI